MASIKKLSLIIVHNTLLVALLIVNLYYGVVYLIFSFIAYLFYIRNNTGSKN